MQHPDAAPADGRWADWRDAAARRDVDAALRDLFTRLDAAIAAHGPRCDLSGRCCRFDSYGHRLYATGLEIAWLVGRLDEAGHARLGASPLPEVDGCPFQVDKLCRVHALRPMGCRIFFCDPAAGAWQNEVYEQHLADLRRLHDRFALPYRYLEWRRGLAEARAALGTGGPDASL